MRSVVSVMVLVAGCSRASPKPPVKSVLVPLAAVPAIDAAMVPDASPPRPPPPPFPAIAKADLVASLPSGELVALAIADGKLTEVGRLPLVPSGDIEEGFWFGAPLEWLDRDHVMMRTQDVLIVSPTKTEVLAVPDEALFDNVPQPAKRDGDGGLEISRGSSGTPSIEANKTIWWNTCVWGFPVDGFQCEVYARTRLWPPDPNHKVESGTIPRGSWPIDHGWVDAKPGFALDHAAEHGLPTCRAKGKLVVLGSPRADSREWVDNHWLPTTPPALVVEYGNFGLANAIPEVFAVYDRCDEKPVLVGTHVEMLSDGLWVASEYRPGTKPEDESEERIVLRLRRGMTVIGDLAPYRAIAVRPK